MKQTCAAFTMCRNEPLWMRVWLAYYSAEVGEQHCFVLVEPNDPLVIEARSLFPKANIVEVPSPKPQPQGPGFYDMGLELWRLRTVSRWQHDLLTRYECVVFGDTDEFLIPQQGIEAYCRDVLIPSGKDRVRCECWTPVQQAGEAPVERASGAQILADRSSMWRLTTYDKTLLVRTPQVYSRGFHLTYEGSRKRVDDPVDPQLPMIHAWRVDLDDWLHDATWRYGATREEAEVYFQTHQGRWVGGGNSHAEGDVQPVPLEWKSRLVYR